MKKLLAALAIVILAGAVGVGIYLWSSSRGIALQALEAKYMSKADRFVDIAGLRVRVREEGPKDATPIILMHGFIYSLESWDEWARDLSADYRVIRFDLAGHGLTGPDPQRRYSPQERADFVGEVMDALGVDQAVVGGNSLGGLAAWRFAAANPERVEGLILVDPGAYSINGVSDEPVEPPKALKLVLRAAPKQAVKLMLSRVYADDSFVSEERLALIRDMMRRRGNGKAYIQSLEEFTLPDPTAALSSIAAPTLILWGREDAMIPVEQGEWMRDAMPDARLVIIDGAGHAPQEEAGARSVKEARSFLQDIAGEAH